jgi:hypothetical protein
MNHGTRPCVPTHSRTHPPHWRLGRLSQAILGSRGWGGWNLGGQNLLGSAQTRATNFRLIHRKFLGGLEGFTSTRSMSDVLSPAHNEALVRFFMSFFLSQMTLTFKEATTFHFFDSQAAGSGRGRYFMPATTKTRLR